VGKDQGGLPREPGLLDILRQSVRQVPANKYAFGVLGIVATALISILLAGGRWQPAVAGGVVVLAGMFLLRVFAESHGRGTKSHSQPVHTQALTWFIIVAFAVVLSFFIAKLYVILFPGIDAAEPTVEITSPSAEATINEASYVVQGISRHVRASDRVWIALQSVKTGKYYLHFNHTQLVTDGRWSSSHVMLSVAHLDEEDFEMIALVVSPPAASQLRDYLRNPLRSPLDELPTGASPACTIRVKIAHPLRGYEGEVRLAEDTGLPEGNTVAEIDQYVPVTFSWEQPSSGQELWVVVFSQSPQLYLPQACVRTETSPAILPCTLEVGAAADFGTKFKILIVEADKGAQRVLTDYIGRIERAGLTELPSDTRVLRTFTVQRKNAN